METLAFLDQTYFLLGLFQTEWAAKSASAPASATARAGRSVERELKTLIMPGGLGSTMKVLVLGKHLGVPRLKGCSFKVRVT